MRGITKMKAVLCLPLFLAVSAVIPAEERGRGLYIDCGLGFGSIIFSGNTKSIADQFRDDAVISITPKLPMITIGWALTQNVYLVGTNSGVSDLFYDSEKNGSGISIFMFGIGARYYPLPDKKHLQLGLDLGASGMGVVQVTADNKEKDSYSSDLGFSAQASVGWDFDSTMTGFAAILGADVMFNVIEGDTSLSYGLFLKLLFK